MRGPVLGCIDADFCKEIANTRHEKAIDEIYNVCKLLHRSELKKISDISSNIFACLQFHVQNIRHFAFVIQNSVRIETFSIAEARRDLCNNRSARENDKGQASLSEIEKHQQEVPKDLAP